MPVNGRTFQPRRARRHTRLAQRPLQGRAGDGRLRRRPRRSTTVQTEEHHGADNNWLPSPFAFAGAVFGATRRIAVTVSAIIGPLHDPLRLAEDIAVLDLLSGGRLVTVAGHRLPARGVRAASAWSGSGAAGSRTSCWRPC